MNESIKTSGIKHKQALIAVAIGTFMGPLDSSVVNIALPQIGKHFNEPISSIEWVVMSYLLIISSLLLTYGRLGDMYGHKKIYLNGFIIFTLGSLFCGVSPNLIFLILSRVVQAVGAGMLMSMGPAIVTDITPPQNRGKALGVTAVAVSVALATGPVLGGLLTSAFGWQSIFYVNIPIGIFTYIFARHVIPDSRIHKAQKFDIAGGIMVFFSLFAILLPLSYTEKVGWKNPYIIASIAAGIILSFLFIALEKRVQHPMIDINLFKNKLFSMSNLAALLSFMAQFSIVLIMPFYLQQLRGFSPSVAGTLIIPMPLTTMIIAPISGTLSDRVDTRFISSAGVLIAGFGIWLLSHLKYGSSTMTIALYLIVIGIGLGLFQTPNNSAVMGSVPNSMRGIASSMLATMRNAGMVLGTAISGALFTSRLNYLTSALSSRGLTGSALRIQSFEGALHFAFTVGALIALASAAASLIRGSTLKEK